MISGKDRTGGEAWSEGQMKVGKYWMEIFGPREGSPVPVLRQRHDIYAPDDTAALAKAKEKFDELAAELKLTNFALYNQEQRLVLETVRKDHR
jgi:hypothetical protein